MLKGSNERLRYDTISATTTRECFFQQVEDWSRLRPCRGREAGRGKSRKSDGMVQPWTMRCMHNDLKQIGGGRCVCVDGWMLVAGTDPKPPIVGCSWDLRRNCLHSTTRRYWSFNCFTPSRVSWNVVALNYWIGSEV